MRRVLDEIEEASRAHESTYRRICSALVGVGLCFFDERVTPFAYQGSGFWVHQKDRLLVFTAMHVTESEIPCSFSLVITSPSLGFVQAEVIAADKEADVAILVPKRRLPEPTSSLSLMEPGCLPLEQEAPCMAVLAPAGYFPPPIIMSTFSDTVPRGSVYKGIEIAGAPSRKCTVLKKTTSYNSGSGSPVVHVNSGNAFTLLSGAGGKWATGPTLDDMLRLLEQV